MEACRNLITKLQVASSTQAEVTCLQELDKQLSTTGTTQVVDFDEDVDKLEQEFLLDPQEAEDPYPAYPLVPLFGTRLELKRFTYYLLDRRYGWSEGLSDGHTVRIRRLGSVVSSGTDERQYKQGLNEKLDRMIRW